MCVRGLHVARCGLLTTGSIEVEVGLYEPLGRVRPTSKLYEGFSKKYKDMTNRQEESTDKTCAVLVLSKQSRTPTTKCCAHANSTWSKP
jgi:hypothetical protein